MQDFTPKLSDFGLAKDGPEGDDTHVSTRVMGTQGYAAPEYIMTGNFSFFFSCIFEVRVGSGKKRGNDNDFTSFNCAMTRFSILLLLLYFPKHII